MVKRKRDRSMLMKLRGGTAPLHCQIEVGRWQGVNREERVCKECQWQERELLGRHLPLADTVPCLGPLSCKLISCVLHTCTMHEMRVSIIMLNGDESTNSYNHS